VIPPADTQFVEATWIMVVKSLVIFAVIFGIVPVMTVAASSIATAPTGSAPSASCSRWPTSSN
jgi:hypothetical protein